VAECLVAHLRPERSSVKALTEPKELNQPTIELNAKAPLAANWQMSVVLLSLAYPGLEAIGQAGRGCARAVNSSDILQHS
jgi:hypothetical protein